MSVCWVCTENDVNTSTHTYIQSLIQWERNVCMSVCLRSLTEMELCYGEQVNEERTHLHTMTDRCKFNGLKIVKAHTNTNTHRRATRDDIQTQAQAHPQSHRTHLHWFSLYVSVCSVCRKSSFKYWENPANVIFIFIFHISPISRFIVWANGI